MSDFDLLALTGGESDNEALVNLFKQAESNGIAVELGSWTGGMARDIGKAMQGGRLYCIDHWRGSVGTPQRVMTEYCDAFPAFKFNMVVANVWGKVKPLVMDAHSACLIFKDEVADFILYDMDYSYDAIMQSLTEWLPKLRHGGILCGHGCEGHLNEFSPEAQVSFEELKNISSTTVVYTPDSDGNFKPSRNGCQMHPGLIVALHDLFGDKYTKIPHTTVWYIKKE